MGFSGIHFGGHENMSPTGWNEALIIHTSGATKRIAPGTRIAYAIADFHHGSPRLRCGRGAVSTAALMRSAAGRAAAGAL